MLTNPARTRAPALRIPNSRCEGRPGTAPQNARAVPVDDGHDRRRCAAHTGGRLITAGKLSYDRAVTVQQLPPIRSYSHLQRIAGRARGNGAVYGMTRASVPRVAQKDVAQAEPPIAAGEFRLRRSGAIRRPAISCLTAVTSPRRTLLPTAYRLCPP